MPPPRLPLLRTALCIAALLLASASAATLRATSYCPVQIIGKCPGTGCSVPTQVLLNYGDTATWTVPADYSGRIQGHPILPGLSNNTYWDALTEFSFIPAGSGQQFAGGCFYDTSYVDLFSVPTVIVPVTTPGANAPCKPNGCNATWAATANCPKGADYDLTHASGRGCYSSAEFCKRNSSSSYCRRLDSEIQRCYSQDPYKSAGCSTLGGPPVITTTQAYAGTPGFTNWALNNGNIYNAALLRGILSNVNDKNQSNWYNLYDNSCTPQYSEYSKWVRDHCAGTIANTGYPYAFSTDDVNNEGATSSCQTTEIDIIFCPADAPGVTPPTPIAFPRSPCSPSPAATTNTNANAATTTSAAAAIAAAASTTAAASVTASGGSASAATTAGTTAAASATVALSTSTAATATTAAAPALSMCAATLCVALFAALTL